MAASQSALTVAVCILMITELILAKKDYYDILGVPKDATDRQIKKAFRKLAMKYHPDKNKSPDAEATFRDVAEAYETLSDEKRRGEYDHLGHRSFHYEGTSGGNHQHFNFDNFFKDFDSYGQNWHDGRKEHFENHFRQHREAQRRHRDSFGHGVFNDAFEDMERMFTFNSHTVRTEGAFQDSTKRHCRTVTQRRGNMVNTYIDCSGS